MGLKITTQEKDTFLEELRVQLIRFLSAEKSRLQIERAFLKSVADNTKEADRKYKQITSVEVYADVQKLLGIQTPTDIQQEDSGAGT